tara:strand:- start:4824 stop:5558 length:735 start_codon:yes stop_codon:yes gene_type:complete
MRYFVEFSYNGSKYHGWQKQPNANSVQQELLRCLSILLQTEIDLVGAGRTDSGVHARQMFAHFDCELSFDMQRIVYKMNSFLPNDLLVNKIFEVSKNAHARFSAISRTYKYYISEKKNIFNPNLHLVYKHLDIDKMNESCIYLLGKKDFTSFSKVNTDTFTNICNITKAVWEKEGDTLVFTVTSNRFLRNMVRSIVGTLIDVGCGKINPLDVKNILDKKDRREAGVSVPAKALFLTQINYPENI